jgi:hypothetical protein
MGGNSHLFSATTKPQITKLLKLKNNLFFQQNKSRKTYLGPALQRLAESDSWFMLIKTILALL